MATNRTYVSKEKLTYYDTKIKAWVTARDDNFDAAGTAQSKIDTFVGTLATVATSGKAEDITIIDSGTLIEATTVEGALAELAGAISGVGTSGAITIEKSTDIEGVAARYTFKQGNSTLPTVIDIPKDMVVESGSVIVLNAEQASAANLDSGAGTYIKLILANAESSEIYIPANSLIEYVTSGSVEGDMVFITIDPVTHKVTASITDGSITKTKLDANVKASLEKADSAVQSVIAANAETGTDGTIVVDGTVVAIKGYAELAQDVSDVKTAVGTSGSVDTKIRNAVEALDVDDDAVTDKYVSAVSEADGKITVTREMLPVRTVASGSANGTISVNGTDVSVKGLGDAAYADTDDFDVAGAAAGVLGRSDDTKDQMTVNGVKKYVDAQIGDIPVMVEIGTDEIDQMFAQAGEPSTQE